MIIDEESVRDAGEDQAEVVFVAPLQLEAPMRLQLALNVGNLADAIEFYSKMFHSAPSKVEHGYANVAIEDPPLKLVLFEGVGEAARRTDGGNT